MEWGFGYGESEYEVSFGLAPRNGAVSPSDSQIPDPGLFRFELPAKFGVGWSKLGVSGHMYPEIKSQWLNYYYFNFPGGEIKNLFLDMSHDDENRVSWIGPCRMRK